MANWADVEFRKTTKRRRVHDLLSLAADILMLWDFLVSIACGEAAHALWKVQFATPREGHTATATLLPEIVIGGLALALALRMASRIKRGTSAPTPLFINSAARSYSFVVAAFVAVAFVIQIAHSSAQLWIIAWFALVMPIIGTTRWGVDRYFGWLEKQGVFRETVAIIGPSDARQRLATRLAANADIVGFCETPLDRTGFLQDDEIENLQKLGTEGRLDSVVLAFDSEQAETDISLLIERLKMLPAQVAICSDGASPTANEKNFRLLGGVSIKIVADRPIKPRDLLIKTILDKTGAAILLGCLLPLIAAIAAAIAATSRGPIIFRQTRQGWCGRRFTVYKFRTMRDAPDIGAKYRQTKRRDPRCTRFGRFLRSTSLDELPQLWNVLLGDMSLVGPRPHADMLDEADRAGREIVAEYAQRFRVKPGITGWAQIHGARGATSTVEQLQHRIAFDLYYIEHWSLWLDVQILARTPLCMAGKNAF